MADVSVTSINLMSGPVATSVPYGETIGIGKLVYLSGSNWMLADCLDGAKDEPVGITILAGVNGSLGVVAMPTAVIDIGSGLVKGVYILSESGNWAPVADLATNDFMTTIGIATSTSQLKVGIVVGGVIK